MRKRHLLVGAVAALAIGGGTAGAIAATNDPREAEREVLADAAQRLGVSEDELRSALSAAQDEQLDEAVKAGELTQEQADEVRAHREREGTVLGGPGGLRGGPPGGPGGPGFGPGGPGGPGFGGPGLGGPPVVEAGAKALGLTPEQLFERLRDGKTVGEIAEAESKDLADVRAAVRKSAVAELDQAVKDERMTQAQRDELVEHLDEHLADLADFGGFDRGGPPHGPVGGPPPRP